MENESGALSRVVGLFSARGYNIESLSVAPTDDDTLSRLTLVTTGTQQVIDQVIKQLNKLIEVVKVLDLSDCKHVSRELMFVKVEAINADGINSIKQIISGTKIIAELWIRSTSGVYYPTHHDPMRRWCNMTCVVRALLS